MAKEDSVDALGSATWLGADVYEPGDVLYERATRFFASVNWDALASISSSLRDGTPCHLGDRFSIGTFNMVRHIVFADGVSWVARLRMPPPKEILGDRSKLDIATTLGLEIASMRFFKARTSIPVPEVHFCDSDTSNSVGAPYMLMDYIHGTVATKLRSANNCAIGLFGTPEQDRKFRRQMASIQATVSSFTFDRIGSLYQDEKTFEFFIGPEFETGKGPWVSSADYYSDLADFRLEECVRNADLETQTSISFAIPTLFKHLISLYGHRRSMRGPFRLVNRDFGAHNLLVNNDFDIVGVIDFDAVMAAPIEVVAQFPALTGLSPETPGHVETRPLAIERIRRTRPRLKEYRDLVEAAEAGMGANNPNRRGGTVASLLLSDAASIYQGLEAYESNQGWVNDRWMQAYLKLLRKHVQAEEALSSIKELFDT
ncbi:Uncharacterized protein TPAR_07635 [Tolypocladium paradoxum]|uniref:Aminoglycoside phosphotransferase domain-containing protein n=1 Tax=Tolypocladium paradoxum TaxID=94208 RepID=A0A2S4KPN1_9HYPO|nr:Uncharacterized protein TPAR_07635 [Tolypocladium paradoxum]